MRTVAFLDILGFRELVERLPPQELGPRFRRVVDDTTRALNQPLLPDSDAPRLLSQQGRDGTYCIRHLFSDSLILISHDDTQESSLAVLIYTLRCMQFLLAARFPVRAGLAHGPMFVDERRSLFLGPALTRAYSTEQNQDWIGGMLDESIPNTSLTCSPTILAHW